MRPFTLTTTIAISMARGAASPASIIVAVPNISNNIRGAGPQMRERKEELSKA